MGGGLVFDESNRDNPGDIDFFDYALGDETGRWDFGCEGDNVGFQWERVHKQDFVARDEGCGFSEFAPQLAAGRHEIGFSDSEGDPLGNPGGPPRLADVSEILCVSASG